MDTFQRFEGQSPARAVDLNFSVFAVIRGPHFLFINRVVSALTSHTQGTHPLQLFLESQSYS
jgi:hypothetical protein